MTRDAKATVISWLTVLIVLGVCIYVIMHIVENHKLEAEKQMVDSIGDLGTIKVSVNGRTYDAKVESNTTAKEFLNILPISLTMNDSDGNRKYSYMYSGLTTSSSKTKNFQAGDIALSGTSTIVVFYKSTNSSGKFIKLGHIDDFPDLGSGSATISFTK